MEEKSRFTMLVRDCKVMANQVCITGLPFGEYKTGAPLYMRKSNLPIVKLDVSMTSNRDGLMEIYTDAGDFPEIMRFAAITDVEPQAVIDPKKPIENPFLLAFTREYRENFKNPEFLNEFCYNLISAKFVVPVVSEDLGKKALDADKKVKVNIGFHFITTEKGRKVLPVCTDWGELNAWKSFKETPNHKTLVLDFDQVSDISTRDGEGFIINPFDHQGVVIPKPFIESIVKSEGYKNHGKVDAKKMTSKSGNVQVGIPQDNEQIKLLKEAITAIGASDDRIKEGYLFLKKDGNDIAFLVVFDLDLAITEDEKKEIFAEATKTISPILGGKLKLEFAMKAPHFIKLCNAYIPVYKAE